MNLGRKRFRRPVCFLKYYCQNGSIEHYRMTKQGFKKIEEPFQLIPKPFGYSESLKRQSFFANQLQNGCEGDLNIQFHLSNPTDFNINSQDDLMNFLHAHYSLIDSNNKKSSLINEEPPLIDKFNHSSHTASKDNSNDSQSSISSDETNSPIESSNSQVSVSTDLSYQQINYSENQIINSNDTENINNLAKSKSDFNDIIQGNHSTIHPKIVDDNVVNQSIYTESQINYTENTSDNQILTENVISTNGKSDFNVQQNCTSGFDDQALYNKIMNDNLTLQLKECHFVKPDEILVLYKIVPD